MSEFTWRERLADWISGGALTDKASDVDYWASLCERCANESIDRYEAIERIKDATDDGKSGTARMVNRMAREALQ